MTVVLFEEKIVFKILQIILIIISFLLIISIIFSFLYYHYIFCVFGIQNIVWGIKIYYHYIKLQKPYRSYLFKNPKDSVKFFIFSSIFSFMVFIIFQLFFNKIFFSDFLK